MIQKGITITNSEIEPFELADICAQAAEAKKAQDILVLDVENVADIAKYFIICSANNDRLVRAIAKSVEENSIKFSVKPKSIEGQQQAEWVLLDYTDVVVHVFHSDAREYYRLERHFKDCDEINWNSLDKAVS